jgi:D-serine dehydratase
MQIEDGAWAITISTVHQMRVALFSGVKRIIMANQVVSYQDMDYIVGRIAADDSLDFYCFIDSVDLVERWADVVSRHSLNRPIQFLLELGYPNGRTGCRTIEGALAVAKAISRHEALSLRGVAGFEGLYQYLQADEAEYLVQKYLEFTAEVAVSIDSENLFSVGQVILTSGGSAFFDMVVNIYRKLLLSKSCRIVLRSGCYITHDSGIYEQHQPARLSRNPPCGISSPRLESALEIWAYIISIPEAGRAIIGAGRRDFGHDAGPPRVLKIFNPENQAFRIICVDDLSIDSINDQHAHLTLPVGTKISVGDMVALGVSHPCTTFDRWRTMFVVDDGYNVLSSVNTYF